MSTTGKNIVGTRRLPVQWLETPAAGPLVISRHRLRRLSGLNGRRGSAGQPRAASGLPPSSFVLPPSTRAFTLLELLMVLTIIGFIAALTLPQVAHFGHANSMASATRQLLDDVALARQRAMVNRANVYMVFLPPMFWNNAAYPIPYSQQESNLIMHQYSAYALVSLATVGDQPGQHNPHYVTDWRFLPSGVFIAPFEFTLSNVALNIFTTNTLSGATFTNVLQPWKWTPPSVPFPSLYPPNVGMSLPCIGFTPQGSLTTTYVNQYIALARGSIFYPTDTNGNPLFDPPPSVVESPPSNDVSNPNLIQIDWMTARPTLVQNQMQ